MNIFPRVSHKRIDECEPADLIRLEWGAVQPWAFLAVYRGEPYVTLLSELQGTAPPRYARLRGTNDHVLSCGKCWRIDIDQSEANVDLTTNRFYRRNGSLILDGERHLLFIEPFPNLAMIPAYLDLAAGAIVEAPQGPAAIFAKWSLAVHMGADRFQTLVSYPEE